MTPPPRPPLPRSPSTTAGMVAVITGGALLCLGAVMWVLGLPIVVAGGLILVGPLVGVCGVVLYVIGCRQGRNSGNAPPAPPSHRAWGQPYGPQQGPPPASGPPSGQPGQDPPA